MSGTRIAADGLRWAPGLGVTLRMVAPFSEPAAAGQTKGPAGLPGPAVRVAGRLRRGCGAVRGVRCADGPRAPPEATACAAAGSSGAPAGDFHVVAGCAVPAAGCGAPGD